MAITIKRGEKTAIPFSITDAANGLALKRVTAAFGRDYDPMSVVFRKASALPGSSADVTISVQNAGQITGTINLSATETANMRQSTYSLTLWVDDGAGSEQVTTAGGVELVSVVATVPRLG